MSRLMTIRSFFSNLLGGVPSGERATAGAASTGFSKQLAALQADADPAVATGAATQATEPPPPEVDGGSSSPVPTAVASAERALTLGARAEGPNEDRGPRADGEVPSSTPGQSQHAAAPADEVPTRHAHAAAAESAEEAGAVEPPAEEAPRSPHVEGTHTPSPSHRLPVDMTPSPDYQGDVTHAAPAPDVVTQDPDRREMRMAEGALLADPATPSRTPEQTGGVVHQNGPTPVDATRREMPGHRQGTGYQEATASAEDTPDRPGPRPASEQPDAEPPSPAAASANRQGAASSQSLGGAAEVLDMGENSPPATRTPRVEPATAEDQPPPKAPSGMPRGRVEAGDRAGGTTPARQTSTTSVAAGNQAAPPSAQHVAVTQLPPAAPGLLEDAARIVAPATADSNAAIAPPVPLQASEATPAEPARLPASHVERLVRHLPEGRLPHAERFTVQQLETALGQDARVAHRALDRLEGQPKQAATMPPENRSGAAQTPTAVEVEPTTRPIIASDQPDVPVTSQERGRPVVMTQDRFFRARPSTAAPIVPELAPQASTQVGQRERVGGATVLPGPAAREQAPAPVAQTVEQPPTTTTPLQAEEASKRSSQARVPEANAAGVPRKVDAKPVQTSHPQPQPRLETAAEAPKVQADPNETTVTNKPPLPTNEAGRSSRQGAFMTPQTEQTLGGRNTVEERPAKVVAQPQPPEPEPMRPSSKTQPPAVPSSAEAAEAQPERSLMPDRAVPSTPKTVAADTAPAPRTPDAQPLPERRTGDYATTAEDTLEAPDMAAPRASSGLPPRNAAPASGGTAPANADGPDAPTPQSQQDTDVVTPQPEGIATDESQQQAMQTAAAQAPSEGAVRDNGRAADLAPSRGDTSSSTDAAAMSASGTDNQGGFEHGNEAGQQQGFDMEPIAALADDPNAVLEPNTVEFEAALRTERAELEATRMPAVEREASSSPAARVARTVLAEAWQAQLLRPGNATMRMENGWQVLRIRLDDDGSMTVRTRQTEQGLSVTVGLTDPALRAQAMAQADRIQQNLQTQLDSPVDFSFQSDQSSSQSGQRDANAQQSARTQGRTGLGTAERQGIGEAPAPRRSLQGQREWVG